MTTVASTQLTLSVTDRDHIRGSGSAVVTLVEYGDYACPRCDEARSVVKGLQTALGDRLRYAFRNFPIPILHPNTHRAAEAAEAAGAQNKFWEMHELLYDRQGRLSEKHLKVYGTEVGLDMERFNRDMMLRTFALHVHEDILSANLSGVRTTPSFFINDSRYLGGCDFATLLFQMEGITGSQSSGNRALQTTPAGHAMADSPTSLANRQ
jgi:protein-disulfide isomerase